MAKKLYLRPLLPLALVLILMIVAYIFAYSHFLSWESLQEVHSLLKNFEEQHPFLTPLLFICIYITYTLLSLPGIFILSLLAGYLFRQPFSTFYVLIAATSGASLLFWVTRSALGQFFLHKAGGLLIRLERGFHKNAPQYLLFLRLIPLCPFWLINIASAFFGVPFLTFIWTTFLGMMPSVFVYTQAGRGLALLLENQEPLNPLNLFNPQLLLALIGLALLALSPILFKRLKSSL